ncbi:MAG: hypothetical protein ACFFG0_40615, partial [Candidatus Thorarchaeota archaeon]
MTLVPILTGPLTELIIGAAIAKQLADIADKLAEKYDDESWNDKWAHGYVGCALRRNYISRFTTEILSLAHECLDLLLHGKTHGTIQDHMAVMFGWDHSYDFIKSRVRKYWFLLFIPIPYYQIIYHNCEYTCDQFIDYWEYLDQQERASNAVQETIMAKPQISESELSNVQVSYRSMMDKVKDMKIDERIPSFSKLVDIDGMIKNISEKEKQTINLLVKANASENKLQDYETFTTSKDLYRYLVNLNTKEVHDINKAIYL